MKNSYKAVQRGRDPQARRILELERISEKELVVLGSDTMDVRNTKDVIHWMKCAVASNQSCGAWF